MIFSSYQGNSDIKKYDFIDALRGMAILGVILVHSSQSVAPTNVTLLWFMGEGARGVQLFYVASALTLCMSWVARSSHETFPIRNFYIRRFFRIAPMFYLAILSYIFVNGFSPSYWAPNGIEWWFVPITAVFLHGFHPETITSVVPGGWSIAVEMSFYFILPFLLPHIKSVKSCAFFFVISLVLSGLNRLIVPHIFSYPESQQYLLQSFSFLNFLGKLPVFIIGIFGYLILREKYPRKLIAIVCGPLFVVLLLAFLYPAFKLPSNFIADKLFNTPHHFIAGGLFCAFALLLANWPTQLLVNKITTTVGKLSFSMYLTHFAILTYFSRLGFSNIFPKSNLASLLHFLCVVFAAAAVSFFFYKYIEKPGIALGKRLIEKSEQDVALNPNPALNTDAAL
ncbi:MULTISPECIES: acyltransferase family protein [Candidatus Kuenenia]|uniref:acyltransferase family protein n=1 Tax=Candidatus Kuenenia TaxID=380738 RepID=UPI0021BC8122|nr:MULTISPECIES: acyltransferase [Kuenenia]MCZ7621086.1 acyltransferase [Candidatus Kuenenia sp.]